MHEKAIKRRKEEMKILQAADAVLVRRLKGRYAGFNGLRRLMSDEMLKIHGEIISLGGVDDLV